MKYLLRTENIVKSKLSYYFSEASKQAFSYLNVPNYDDKDIQNSTKLIAILIDVISQDTNFRKEETRFTHYINKHKEIPLWVLIKKLTFG